MTENLSDKSRNSASYITSLWEDLQATIGPQILYLENHATDNLGKWFDMIVVCCKLLSQESKNAEPQSETFNHIRKINSITWVCKVQRRRRFITLSILWISFSNHGRHSRVKDISWYNSFRKKKKKKCNVIATDEFCKHL